MSILDRCIKTIPSIKSKLGQEWTVAISDDDKILYYEPGEVDLDIKVGDKISDLTNESKSLFEKFRNS